MWWLCEGGHYFKSSVDSQYKGFHCKYCSNRAVWPGFNDFETLEPELMMEWDWDKNVGIDPSFLPHHSPNKYWWICPDKKHSWDCSLTNRVHGNKCRYCRGWLLEGETDLASRNPELARDWDFDKNGDILPSMVTVGNLQKYWWKCPIGHSWRATVASRNKGAGCKECQNIGTSYPEQVLLYYLKKVYPDAINRDVSLGYELDIYIPSIMTAIEYDGVAFHKNNARLLRDNKKDRNCVKDGVNLFRIREKGLEKTESALCVMRKDFSDNDLVDAIYRTFELMDIRNVDIDLNRDRIKILNQFYTYVKKGA